MLWAVPVLPRAYRYCPDHTGTAQNILVLPRIYRYCPEHTGSKNKPVLPRAFRYCLEHTGTVTTVGSSLYGYSEEMGEDEIEGECFVVEDDSISVEEFEVEGMEDDDGRWSAWISSTK